MNPKRSNRNRSGGRTLRRFSNTSGCSIARSRPIWSTCVSERARRGAKPTAATERAAAAVNHTRTSATDFCVIFPPSLLLLLGERRNRPTCRCLARATMTTTVTSDMMCHLFDVRFVAARLEFLCAPQGASVCARTNRAHSSLALSVTYDGVCTCACVCLCRQVLDAHLHGRVAPPVPASVPAVDVCLFVTWNLRGTSTARALIAAIAHLLGVHCLRVAVCAPTMTTDRMRQLATHCLKIPPLPRQLRCPLSLFSHPFFPMHFPNALIHHMNGGSFTFTFPSPLTWRRRFGGLQRHYGRCAQFARAARRLRRRRGDERQPL